MHKIRLSLDKLSVESFETLQIDDARRGTIQGFAPPTPAQSCICSEPSCVATGCQIWVSCVIHCP